MKKFLTLGALGLLASFGAQAQITLDGTISPNEIGTGTGKYQSIGQYTGPHGYGPWGLKQAYFGEDANFIYIGVNGTVEANASGNSLFAFFDAPNQPGKPACTALPAAPSASGDATGFTAFNHTLEMEVDAGLAFRAPGGAGQLELCDYRAAAPASVILGPLASDGTSGMFGPGNAIRSAYKAPSGDITTNTNEGWEIAVAKAAYGLTTGMDMKVFVLMGNQDGGYLSSDFIPMDVSAAGGVNLDQNANFCNVAGSQFVTFRLGTGVLGVAKLADNAINFTVSPNPVAGQDAAVEFTVADKAQQGSVIVTDLMGRSVATLANGNLLAGVQRLSLKTANLASGTYLVKLQLGEKVATRKVVVL